MYAKVFNQIFDSSIADDYQLRHFFMDLLVLADPNGVVDMTQKAIAARTRIPLEDVVSFLAKLEQPDRESRSPDADGRRIERLDGHRTWGWHIINYDRFRQTASEEQRREKTLARVTKFREKNQKGQQSEDCNAPVTHGNACNAMQKQMQMQMQKQKDTGGSRTSFQKPSLEQVKLAAAKTGLPDAEGEKFFYYYESKGWKVGNHPMKSLGAALGGWKLRWQERQGRTISKSSTTPPTTF